MATDFEKLNIILAARDREFARAMDRNTARIERFERKAKKSLSRTTRHFDGLAFVAKRMGPLLAVLSAGAVIGKLKRTVATLDDIGKTADKIGLTTDALQELRTIAESAGIAQGSLDSSLERFSKRIGEAAMGTGAANKVLKEMNLTAADLATMGLDKALALVADKMALIGDPTERAAKAAALFGREGVAMFNMMREGSAGMEKMRAEARELGIIIDENLIRKAEGAQTKLDLMSRVISAQLSSALIDLAPLLVGGATAIADFVRGVVSAIDAVQAFMDPQSAFETATENLIIAMADEIRQSQLLETALGRGINMSVSAARTKLEEARARHENVTAIIAEHKALTLGSHDFTDLTKQIRQGQAMLSTLGFPEIDVAAPGLSDEFEAQQQHLADLIKERQGLLRTNEDMDAQLARSAANIKTLEGGLKNQKGGVVSIEGSYVTPITNSPKEEIKRTGSAAKVAIPELSDYADVMAKINAIFGDMKGIGDGYADTMAKIQMLFDTGEISAEEYADAVAAIGQHFEDTKSAAESMEQATEQLFIGIIDGSKSAKDAVADLLKQFSGMALNSAFKGLFGGLFDGVAGLFSSSASAFPGFSKGGYTGSGGRMQPAGMVHKGEYVFDQAATRRIGVGNLQAMQAGATPRAPQTGGRQRVELIVHAAEGITIEQVRGESVRITQAGLMQYDRTLPDRVAGIQRDPRARG